MQFLRIYTYIHVIYGTGHLSCSLPVHKHTRRIRTNLSLCVEISHQGTLDCLVQVSIRHDYQSRLSTEFNCCRNYSESCRTQNGFTASHTTCSEESSMRQCHENNVIINGNEILVHLYVIKKRDMPRWKHLITGCGTSSKRDHEIVSSS